MHFDGDTYDPIEDYVRLSTQLESVLWVMSDYQPHTLKGIQTTIKNRTGREFSVQGISARIRDLRKDRFGALTIEKRRIAGGLWEYQLKE